MDAKVVSDSYALPLSDLIHHSIHVHAVLHHICLHLCLKALPVIHVHADNLRARHAVLAARLRRLVHGL